MTPQRKGPTDEITLERIYTKLEALETQVAALQRVAEENRRRREQWDDLARDLEPILNDMYMLAVRQLEEASPYVQLEDLIRLGTRLLRSVRHLERLLIELESLQDLVHDVSPMTHDAFQLLVERLDYMDKAGYFPRLQALFSLADALLTHLSPDDIRQLAEHADRLIALMRVFTHPHLLETAAALAHGWEEAVTGSGEARVSTWYLVKQMGDPQVRRGVALTLHLLQVLGKTAEALSSGNGVDQPHDEMHTQGGME